MEQIKSSPEFPEHYEKLKQLLEDPDTMVIGFAVRNDVGFLLDECFRYQLQPFSFRFYDIQQIIERQEINQEGRSLEKAYEAWCGEIPEIVHRSDADAELTMQVLAALCRYHSLYPDEMLTENEEYSGFTRDFTWYFPGKDPVDHLSKKPQYDEEGYRIPPAGKENWMLKGTRNRDEYMVFLDSVRPEGGYTQDLAGQYFCFSQLYEERHCKEMFYFVQMIVNRGGRYTKSPARATKFVCSMQKDLKCPRQKKAEHEMRKGGNVEILEFPKFLQLMGVTRKELKNLPSMEQRRAKEEENVMV
jgi:DNA polymerase III epsilon subunit-like protein